MAVKPVKVLTDLLTKKQVIKQDLDGNILFRISGSLNNGIVSSSLPVTGSSGLFNNLNTQTTSIFNNIDVVTGSGTGIYSVDQAFHAIDSEISDIRNIIGGGETDATKGYKRLRYQQVGYFDSDGTAEVILPKQQYDGDAFPVSSLDYINVSVMVRDGNAWTNDLLAVNVVTGGVSGDEIHVLIDAPALSTTDQYRLLAVNENPNDYMI